MLSAQTLGGVEVMGRVLDASTGQAIAGASVRLAGRDTIHARTDAGGVWRAQTTGGRYDATVRAVGFRLEAWPLDAGRGQPIRTELVPIPRLLDRVVVTAARREQRLADVVTTTELISREDIARSGATDLAGVIGARTGVELSGGLIQGTGVMLQGLGSTRVLVLLDGQPLPGRVNGEFDVSRIPTSSVERIEIVKGPQSTLYGTDAMGGVINVITRGAEPSPRPQFTMSGIAGSQNRQDASVSATTSIGPVDTRGELGRRYIETAPGRQDEAGALASRFDGAFNAKWSAGDATVLDARAMAVDERQRFLSGSLYTFGDNVQVTARLSAERRLATGTVRALLYGSSYDHVVRSSTLPNPIRGDTGQRQNQRLLQAELMHTRQAGAHLVDVGIQLRTDDTKSERIPGGRRSTTTVEPLAQAELQVTSQLSVTPGVRVSHSNRWGDRVTPRLAARYRPVESLTLRVAAGTGFRAPDFRELYLSFVNSSAGYAVYGNPNLRPEDSRNVMVGADWTSDAAFARAQLFHNEFRGFIETRIVSDPGSAPVFEYGNVDNGFTRGIELETGRNWRRLTSEAGYSFLEARDRTTGFELLGRPKHSGRLSLTHPIALGVRGSATGIYTGRTAMTRDASGAIDSWREAYPQLNARFARDIGQRATLSLNVDNVLDRQPAEWAGFTGRQLFLGASWRSN